MLDVCSLAFSSAVTGAVDGAGGAMGTDANGGGTRGKLVALAYTIIDWHILEVGTIRAVVVYVELGCAGRGGGHSERQKDEGQGGEAAHAGDHGYKIWKVVVRLISRLPPVMLPSHILLIVGFKKIVSVN